jgi:hypothetical protein
MAAFAAKTGGKRIERKVQTTLGADSRAGGMSLPRLF